MLLTRNSLSRTRILVCLAVLGPLSSSVQGAEPTAADTIPASQVAQPAISIIIDDLGNLKSRDLRAIHLPGAVTYAFLPHTPHARKLAQFAHGLDKEVMLHQPMQAMRHNHLGPGGMTLDMTQEEFAHQLKTNLKSVPFAAGINNHMGSLLTQHPGHMGWLMQAISKHDKLYFVDSYTTKTSVARQLANEHWVPNIRRDIFLDDERKPAQIKLQFQRLLKKARENGIALAIGHPYPETLALLEAQLPLLKAQGIALVPVSELLERQVQRFRSSRASLSPKQSDTAILK